MTVHVPAVQRRQQQQQQQQLLVNPTGEPPVDLGVPEATAVGSTATPIPSIPSGPSGRHAAMPGATQPPVPVSPGLDRAGLSPAIQALWRLRDGTLRPRPTEEERVALGIPPQQSAEYEATWPSDVSPATLRQQLQQHQVSTSVIFSLSCLKPPACRPRFSRPAC